MPLVAFSGARHTIYGQFFPETGGRFFEIMCMLSGGAFFWREDAMAYEEYSNRRGGKKGSPLRRLKHWIADLRAEYRLGWMIGVAAALAAGFHFLSARSGPLSAAPHSFGEREYPRIETGADADRLARTLDGEYLFFVAETDIEGFGNGVQVFFDLEDEAHPALTAAQMRAFDRIRADYPALRGKIMTALLDSFRKEREVAIAQEKNLGARERLLAKAMGVDLALMLPDLKTEAELVSRLSASHLNLWCLESDGAGYAVVMFEPDWTVDLIGAVVHGDEVVFAGSEADYRYDIVPGFQREEEPAGTDTGMDD